MEAQSSEGQFVNNSMKIHAHYIFIMCARHVHSPHTFRL